MTAVAARPPKVSRLSPRVVVAMCAPVMGQMCLRAVASGRRPSVSMSWLRSVMQCYPSCPSGPVRDPLKLVVMRFNGLSSCLAWRLRCA